MLVITPHVGHAFLVGRAVLGAVPRLIRCVTEHAEPRRVARRGLDRIGVDRFAQRAGRVDDGAIYSGGIHFRDRVVLVALGIDSKGEKHVLGLGEGSTENATVVRTLIADLIERMEQEGIVSPASSSGKREILLSGNPGEPR